MEYVTLNNGVQMPKLGYGVYQTPLEETARCVLEAMEIGYRSIDTAQAYGNEAGVGRALEESGLHREELFLTTKIWISNAGYEKAKASIAASLEKLRTNYIDLLLIHQPFGDYYGSYRAMEEAWRAGTVRAIGVSNFYPDRYLDLTHFAEIPPAVNQVEMHVFQQQKTARTYLEQHNTQIMSWGPFAEGRNDYFRNPVLNAVGKAYGKRLHRWRCAFCCKAARSSFQNPPTKNGWRKTFRCLISRSRKRIWCASRLWIKQKACFLLTTIRPWWNGF